MELEFLQVFPLHKCKEWIWKCCDLLNAEWPRSRAARYQSLYVSCDQFPTSLVLILNEEKVVGHCKISEIRLKGKEVMIESVIIDPQYRGKGWGKMLMEDAENYARRKGKTMVYLSTQGKEGFYRKLGYQVCKPIHYYGFPEAASSDEEIEEPKGLNGNSTCEFMPSQGAPPPPPPPPVPLFARKPRPDRITNKTFMRKEII